MKQENPALTTQQSLQFEKDHPTLALPDKNASHAEVYAYAEQRFQGNKQRAASFVNGWFMISARLQQKT